MKKNTLVAILLLIAMLIPNMVSAGGNSFSDTKNHWANEYIIKLVDNGIISGYPDGSFKPENTIKVSEFTKLIISSLNETVEKYNTGEWYEPYIDKAKDLDIIIEGEFNTYNRNITRAEMCRIAVRALNEDPSKGTTSFLDDYKISETFKGYVKKAVELGIVNGYTDNTFKPENSVTRAEASKIIHSSREKLHINKGDDKKADLIGVVKSIDGNLVTIIERNESSSGMTQEEIQNIKNNMENMSEEERQKLREQIKGGNSTSSGETITIFIPEDISIVSINGGNKVNMSLEDIEVGMNSQIWFGEYNTNGYKTAKHISIIQK